MPGDDKGFFGHPRGLSTLFFTEMWERFSYYGIRALLILFMTAAAEQHGMGLNVMLAGVIYGLYTSCAYIFALPAGWIADRFLGHQRAVAFAAARLVRRARTAIIAACRNRANRSTPSSSPTADACPRATFSRCRCPTA